MKRSDFFDNLNIVFANSDEEEEYAFTKAVVYRNVETGDIQSIQILNTEYREFMIIDRDGSIDFINIDEEEQEKLIGTSNVKKTKRK